MRQGLLGLHGVIVVGTLVFALTSGGCFSSHYGSDLSKLDDYKIEKNVTTEKDLVDQFGEPNNTTMRSDGSKVLMWGDARGSASFNPATAVPVVGMFAHDEGHGTHKSLTAIVRDGVVVDYTISGGQTTID